MTLNADYGAEAEHHHCHIRYVVTCSECGDIGDVTSITDGSYLCMDHEEDPHGERPYDW